METVSLFPCKKTYTIVKKLYYEAFPKEERLSFFRLWLLSRLRQEAALEGYGENGRIFGFSFTVCNGYYHYIVYMAVSPEARGAGRGSEILAYLRGKYPQPLLVEIESPLQESMNFEQRQRRLAFYLRNGFEPLERSITNKGVSYLLLSTGKIYNKSKYFELFECISFGLRRKLKKIFRILQ